MKKFIMLFPALFFILHAAAQLSPCYTDEAIKDLIIRKPVIGTLIKQAELSCQLIQETKQPAAGAVVTIPVVVHIVYNLAEQNIADSQVISQIEVMNEDFRRQNPDTANVRSIFKVFASDARIQFCLASRDPQGNPTSGITRTATYVADFGCDDQVKFDTAGGKTGWDPSKYLNIWVCKLNCANGYAYYPGIPAQYDGVVVHYWVFGNTGNIAPGYKGRTATHETGHWLGFLDNAVCPGASQAAPVMMQQSVNLSGCIFNPWPLASELARL